MSMVEEGGPQFTAMASKPSEVKAVKRKISGTGESESGGGVYARN